MIYWNTKHRLSPPTVHRKRPRLRSEGLCVNHTLLKAPEQKLPEVMWVCVCTCLRMWGSWCSYFNGEERLNTSNPPPHLTVPSELQQQQLLGASSSSRWASPHWNAICTYEFCTLGSTFGKSRCTYSLSIFSSSTYGSNWPRLPLEHTK